MLSKWTMVRRKEVVGSVIMAKQKRAHHEHRPRETRSRQVREPVAAFGRSRELKWIGLTVLGSAS